MGQKGDGTLWDQFYSSLQALACEVLVGRNVLSNQNSIFVEPLWNPDSEAQLRGIATRDDSNILCDIIARETAVYSMLSENMRDGTENLPEIVNETDIIDSKVSDLNASDTNSPENSSVI